jgi:hypothetical protein
LTSNADVWHFPPLPRTGTTRTAIPTKTLVNMLKTATSLLALAATGHAWEFPRVALAAHREGQHPFFVNAENEDVDIVSGSQFHGLKTFANLPYLNCFSDEETQNSKYDIAIMGAPFDTVRPAMASQSPYAELFGPVDDWTPGHALRPDWNQNWQPKNELPGFLECLHRSVK